MPAQHPTWSTFWMSERHAFDDVMRLATQYFARQFCNTFKPDRDARVLDYGCGPGFLADVLIPTGVDFYGADINEYFIDICRQHHPDTHFFAVHVDAERNKQVLQTTLPGQMDFIILLSITQYLSSTQDLERIISILKPHLKTGGAIIVADVVDKDSRSYRDALSLLYHAARKGKIRAFVRFMRYVLHAEYARVAKTIHLQLIPEHFMHEMSTRAGLSCRRIDGLTFHPTRKNYILELHG